MNRTELNALTAPLQDSILIEAAAGTGKTFNIQTIVLRLLLEKRIPIEQILVVTFTEDAASELRNRIASVLRSAYNILKGAASEKEDRIESVLSQIAHADAESLLENALMNFDNSPIQTIHGFCRAMLTRNAFECGILFQTELCTDVQEVLYPIIDHCYRRLFYDPENESLRNAFCASGVHAANEYASDCYALEDFRSTLKPFILRPELKIETMNDSEYSLAGLLDEAEKLKKNYPHGLLKQLAEKVTKKGNPELLAMADELFSTPETSFDSRFMSVVRYLDPENLHSVVSKRKNADEELSSPFFQYCRSLDLYAQGFWKKQISIFAAECKKRFDQAKQQENFQTFNDLLSRLYDRINDPDSTIADRIAQQYKAAVVDEFQDTDPVQYGIFSKVFCRMDHVFYMVGDPRQAIYSFRGGDIFMYRQASVSAQHIFTLTKNFRSSPGIIRSVNRIFAEHCDPFADPEITFPPVIYPEDSRVKKGLFFDGAEVSHPISFVNLPECAGNTCLNTVKWTVESCAAEIAAMLNDPKWQCPEKESFRSLTPNDFAVLCYRQDHCRLMQKKLADLGIPSTLANSGSLFQTEEARELELVLTAVSDPANRKAFSAALCTKCIGFDVTSILAGESPENLLAVYREKFYGLKRSFLKGSFIGMFQDLMDLFKLPERILSGPGGERALANYLQLRDTLHEATLKSHFSLEALIHYFSRMRSSASADEDIELQLETDRPAVRLMTIHKSKGLEFPVVFLPDLFLLSPIGLDTIYHREHSLYKEPSFTNSGKTAPQYEALQEKLRLAYVAITRAKYFCRISFTDFKEGEVPSVLDWLFRMKNERILPHTHENVMAALLEKYSEKSLSEAVRDSAGDLYTETPIAGPCSYLPEIPPLKSMEQIFWPGTELKGRTFLSYTSLGSRKEIPMVADYDDDLLETPLQQNPDSADPVFRLPRGDRTGIAIHALLERLDFSASKEQIQTLTERLLPAYGFPLKSEELETIRDLIFGLFHSPFAMPDGTSFQLKDIPQTARISEMNFDFSFHAPSGFHSGMLEHVFSAYLEKRFGFGVCRLTDLSVEKGLMTGILDLLFLWNGKYYILDWKTNILGSNFQNFMQDGLVTEICSSQYYIQYLLYSLAVLKFLSMRFNCTMDEAYSKYFGGVYYVFLRGVSPDVPGRGIFYEKPDYLFLRDLNTVFEGEK